MTEEETKALHEELQKLQQEKAALDDELTARDNLLSEIQQALTAKDGELGVLQQNITELKNQLGSVSDNLAQAVTSYRNLVIKANPEIPSELVTGDTIEAIENTAANAVNLVNKVKETLIEERLRGRVPAGAPQRTPPDLSALSPREKIRQGISPDLHGKR